MLVLGLGGNNLKSSFGFKLDTFHNTSTPKAVQMAEKDPYRLRGGGAFGGWIQNVNGRVNTEDSTA